MIFDIFEERKFCFGKVELILGGSANPGLDASTKSLPMISTATFQVIFLKMLFKEQHFIIMFDIFEERSWVSHLLALTPGRNHRQ